MMMTESYLPGFLMIWIYRIVYNDLETEHSIKQKSLLR